MTIIPAFPIDRGNMIKKAQIPACSGEYAVRNGGDDHEVSEVNCYFSFQVINRGSWTSLNLVLNQFFSHQEEAKSSNITRNSLS